MSGQIVPGSRNGLTTQGYPGLGPILNSDSNLLNRNSQGSLNQQSQINLNVSSSFKTSPFQPNGWVTQPKMVAMTKPKFREHGLQCFPQISQLKSESFQARQGATHRLTTFVVIY